MFLIAVDEKVDGIFIELEEGTAGYCEELDDDRVIDYSLNPGEPIGVCLHNVSKGVKTTGLPQAEKIGRVLEALGYTVVA